MLYAEDVIIKPIITEKSYMEMANGKYTFQTKIDATKIDIKNAVETLFNVKVLIPTSSPAILTSGPPLLPSFNTTSLCSILIKYERLLMRVSKIRLFELIIPSDTDPR